MVKISVSDMVRATGADVVLEVPGGVVEGVQTDSRAVGDGT